MRAVAYAICQLPKSEMTEAYTHAELEEFAASSYTASRAIAARYLGRPTLPLLVSMIGRVSSARHILWPVGQSFVRVGNAHPSVRMAYLAIITIARRAYRSN